jgi:hypothetical protein
MEGGLFRRGQLPKARKTPNNKTLRSAQGSIDRSKLDSSDFSEQGGSYRMGGNGNYFFGETSVEHYLTPIHTDFAESTLVDTGAALWRGRSLSIEQKTLWALLKNQVEGMFDEQKRRKIENYILNNSKAQKVAMELVKLRQTKTRMNQGDRMRKLALESQMGHITSAFRRETR